MVSTCRGCRVTVELDVDTGRLRASDGATGTATFNDPTLIVWNCPSCDYPHADHPR